MDTINFLFKGKAYSAYIVSSINEFPHYFWCFVNDIELASRIGDCLVFRSDGAGIETLKGPVQEDRALIEILKEIISRYFEPVY